MMLLMAQIRKELLLLSRDRAGLLVLFVMPMLLVLVLSLIQDNLFRANGQSASEALFVNLDQGEQGAELGRLLSATGALELVTATGEEPLTSDAARQQVMAGNYQFALLVPADFSAKLNAAAEQSIRGALHDEEGSLEASGLLIYFDPTVRGVYRGAVTNALQRGVLGLEFARKAEAFGRLLPLELKRTMVEQFGEDAVGQVQFPQISSSWGRQSLIALHEAAASPQKYQTLPTSVQQNVPAWTLFGMFFIVIPLAGTLIRERQEGTLTRLMSMPVATASLLLGKVLAYLCICLIQFGLMLAVGRFVLPLLGTPELEIGSAPLALLVVAFCAALAACSYGILVGVLARSYEQASSFGAVSVVIAAALGGVMVPVYVMPPAMQQLSVLSPLGWGLDAFLDIFVRHGNLGSVLNNIGLLSAFSLCCLLVAGLVSRRWRRGV